jgi:Cys-tRNA(Pro) deacylase
MGKKKRKVPVTAGVRALRSAGVAFDPHLYPYETRGGTAVSSAALGVDEHAVIKTLVMADETGAPMVILMHGDREVATGVLARTLGARKVSPCDPPTAQRHSGYQVGGTSPFGLRTAMPIYAERTIGELDRLYINGGKRGFLVSMAPAALTSAIDVIWVDAAQPA